MTNTTNILSISQLKAAVRIKEKIEVLEAELASIVGSSESVTELKKRGRPRKNPTTIAIDKPKRKMSAAGRAKISAAAKARWAKKRAEKTAGN
jgi:uncharacterized protein YoxC